MNELVSTALYYPRQTKTVQQFSITATMPRNILNIQPIKCYHLWAPTTIDNRKCKASVHELFRLSINSVHRQHTYSIHAAS